MFPSNFTIISWYTPFLTSNLFLSPFLEELHTFSWYSQLETVKSSSRVERRFFVFLLNFLSVPLSQLFVLKIPLAVCCLAVWNSLSSIQLGCFSRSISQIALCSLVNKLCRRLSPTHQFLVNPKRKKCLILSTAATKLCKEDFNDPRGGWRNILPSRQTDSLRNTARDFPWWSPIQLFTPFNRT